MQLTSKGTTASVCSAVRTRVCRDQLAKLSVHVEIASELNRQIDERRLTDLGKLEQVRWRFSRAWRVCEVRRLEDCKPSRLAPVAIPR